MLVKKKLYQIQPMLLMFDGLSGKEFNSAGVSFCIL